jgi:hypothetical protein
VLQTINAASKDAAFFFALVACCWRRATTLPTRHRLVAEKSKCARATSIGLKKFAQFVRIVACATRKGRSKNRRGSAAIQVRDAHPMPRVVSLTGARQVTHASYMRASNIIKEALCFKAGAGVHSCTRPLRRRQASDPARRVGNTWKIQMEIFLQSS